MTNQEWLAQLPPNKLAAFLTRGLDVRDDLGRFIISLRQFTYEGPDAESKIERWLRDECYIVAW